jgi:hypothetical protein
MLIFNDMVALATPVSERQGLFKSRKEPVRFRVVAPYDGGIGSVEDVREIKDWAGEFIRVRRASADNEQKVMSGHSHWSSVPPTAVPSLPRMCSLRLVHFRGALSVRQPLRDLASRRWSRSLALCLLPNGSPSRTASVASLSTSRAIE